MGKGSAACAGYVIGACMQSTLGVKHRAFGFDGCLHSCLFCLIAATAVEAEAAALLAKARKAKAGKARARRAPASRKKATPAEGMEAVRAAGKATSGAAAGGDAGALPEGAVQKKTVASGSKKAAAGGGEKAAAGASGKKAAGGSGGVNDGKSSNVFEVEKVLATREVDGKGGKKLREYKIRWVGYGSEEDTWEPERNLGKAALAAYRGGCMGLRGAAGQRVVGARG